MKAELVPENGDPPIPITRDVTVIGRRDDCDVTIKNNSLSKRHAVVVKTDGLLIIRDLATTNGTKFEGQRIKWAALLPDNRISLGNYKFRVYLGPDNVPAPSEVARRGETIRQAPAPIQKNYQEAYSGTELGSGTSLMTGFASPSPLGVPILHQGTGELEILEDENDNNRWRQVLAAKVVTDDDDDVVIEL